MIDRFIDSVQDRLGLGEQALASFRERYAARGSIEKPNAKSVLQRTDHLTDAWPRNPKLFCSLRETPLFRNRHKSA
jgi:hypothetical protein